MANDSTGGSDEVGATTSGQVVPITVAAPSFAVVTPSRAISIRVKHVRGDETVKAEQLMTRDDGTITIDFSALEPGDVITIEG